MNTVRYIAHKHQQKVDVEQKRQRVKDELHRKMNNQPSVGLGHGYTLDMTEAMRKVNEFDYTPSEDEIHYRRLTSGQWIDNPKPTSRK